MSKAKVTGLSFDRLYSDESGIEFGVRTDGKSIFFEHIGDVRFPIEELDWLIACLQKIKAELPPGLPA